MGKHTAEMRPGQRASEDYAKDPAVHGFLMNVNRSWVSNNGTSHAIYEYVLSESGWHKSTGRHSKFVVLTFCTCGNDLDAYNVGSRSLAARIRESDIVF